MALKKIGVDGYDGMKKDELYTFETLGFVERDGSLKFGPIGQEIGRLIAIHTKEREIKKDDKWTGKFETVGDVVVFEKLNPDLSKIPGYYYTVIGCGMFRVFTEE